MRNSAFALAAILAVTTVGPARAQQTTVRETIQIGPEAGMQIPGLFGAGRPQFKTGTAKIRGRVMKADGTGILRRAQVRVSSSESGPKSATTDAQDDSK